MKPSDAKKLARVAGRCTAVFFLAAPILCAFSGDANIGPVLFAFLLIVLALASLIVWLTARDIAADEPPDARPPRAVEPVMRSPKPEESRTKRP